MLPEVKHSDIRGTISSYGQACLAGLDSRAGEGREGGRPSVDVAPRHEIHTERYTLDKKEPMESKTPRIDDLKGSQSSMVWNRKKTNEG